MPTTYEYIKKWLIALFVFRFLIGLCHGILPLDEPHVWRQTDTMGTTFRYWNRWTSENKDSAVEVRGRPLGAMNSIFLPAILNSSDTAGIMPMEFPFLNVVTAPG